tara:strand:+ start:7824 stop:7988 length:165 start_codon:yes stop_codon:yes gene_type:complete
MLNIEEKIEEIADTVELKFDLEKFYPFEEKINELFNRIEDNVNSYKTQKDNRSI